MRVERTLLKFWLAANAAVEDQRGRGLPFPAVALPTFPEAGPQPSPTGASSETLCDGAGALTRTVADAVLTRSLVAVSLVVDLRQSLARLGC